MTTAADILASLSPPQQTAADILALVAPRQARDPQDMFWQNAQLGQYRNRYDPRLNPQPDEQPATGVLRDVAQSAASGFGTGATGLADLPGMAINFGIDAAARLASAATGSDAPMQGATQIRETMQGSGLPYANPTANRDAVNAATGGGLDYQPATAPGEYAQTIAEFAPGALLTGGVGALVPYAVAPGALSEFLGQRTENMTFPEGVPVVGGQPVEPYARVAGALAGPSVFNAGARLLTPNPSDPSRVAATQRLRAEGVTPTAGQATGNRQLRLREDYIPRTAQMFDDQSEQFTAAVLRRVGIESNRATPEVISTRMAEIGGVFDDVASRANNLQVQPRIAQRVQQIVANYADDTANSNMVPRIGNIADDLLTRPANQPISGAQYNQWRSRLSRLTSGSDRQTAQAAADLIDVLDDMLSTAVSASDVAAIQQARAQWRDVLAITRVMAGGGEDAAAGIISPARLRQALSSQSRNSYALARRDLDRLARDGAFVMNRPGNSNTPDRLIANMPLLQSGGGAVGAGSVANFMGADPLVSGGLAAAAFTAPYARNALIGSRLGQNYLMNQIAPYGANLLSAGGATLLPPALRQGENR